MTTFDHQGSRRMVAADEAPSAIRRVAGWFIDYMIVVVPGVALVALAIAFLIQNAGTLGVSTGFNAGEQFVLDDHMDVFKLVRGFTWPVLAAILTIPLMQFLYLTATLTWWGRTAGKAIMDTRVVPATASGQLRLAPSRAAIRAFCTTALDTGLVGIAFLGLSLHPVLGVMLWVVAVAAFWGNLFGALGSRRRTVVDLVSGTRVVRTRMYADAAARAADLARRTSGAAATAGRQTTAAAAGAARQSTEAAAGAARRTADLAVTTGQWGADVAAVAGQGAREGVQAVTRSAPVQQAAAKTGDAVAAAAAAAARGLESAQAVARSIPVQQAVEKTVDVAAAVAQSAKENAEKLARSAPVQQALNSQAAQQAQAMGAAGTQRARELGGRTADQARQVRGRVQQLWREQRAGRTGQGAAEDGGPEWTEEVIGSSHPAAPADRPVAPGPDGLPPEPLA